MIAMAIVLWKSIVSANVGEMQSLTSVESAMAMEVHVMQLIVPI